MARTKKPKFPTCRWAQDENVCYHTDCNHAFQFDDGTAYENGFKYCPFCGRILISIAQKP